jgi:hypothetical protein
MPRSKDFMHWMSWWVCSTPVRVSHIEICREILPSKTPSRVRRQSIRNFVTQTKWTIYPDACKMFHMRDYKVPLCSGTLSPNCMTSHYGTWVIFVFGNKILRGVARRKERNSNIKWMYTVHGFIDATVWRIYRLKLHQNLCLLRSKALAWN